MTKLRSRQNTIFFVLIFIGISIVSFLMLKPYLSLIALTFLITALFRPFYNGIFKVTRSTFIATVTSVLAVFLSILIPVLFIGYLTYNQVLEFENDVQQFVNSRGVDSIGDVDIENAIDQVNDIIHKIPGTEDVVLTKTEVRDAVSDTLEPAVDFLADRLISYAGSSLSIISGIVVFIVLLATLFPSQEKIIAYYQKISPLEDEIDSTYINKITAMGIAMIKGTFVVAVLQGLLSGFFLWLVGVEYVAFWIIACIFFSVIPLGSGIVTVPIGIIVLLSGNVYGGLLIIFSYILIIGNIDNVLRPRLVPKSAQLHPTLGLLGILGGIQLFGPLGFIFGPIVMIFLTTTLEVYLKYYKD